MSLSPKVLARAIYIAAYGACTAIVVMFRVEPLPAVGLIGFSLLAGKLSREAFK